MIITFKDIEENVKEQKEYKEGVYQVRITNVTEGVWQQAKSEYLEVEFETMGEEQFKVRHRFTKSPKALSILLNFLSAIGIYDKNSKEDLHFENNDLLGAILEVEFKKGEENANGKCYLEYVAWSAKSVGDSTVKKAVVEQKDDSEQIPF